MIGQQFLKYQQSRTLTSHLKSVNTKKVHNIYPGPGLEQAQKYGMI